MSKKQQTEQLTPQELNQVRDILDWWNMTRRTSGKPVKFIHEQFKICTVRLNKQLQEKAEKYALISPEFKSFSNMVETLIWRELGCSPEYLQTIATDQDQGQDADKA